MLFPNNVVLNVKTFDRFKNECFLNCGREKKTKLWIFKDKKKAKPKREFDKKHNYY